MLWYIFWHTNEAIVRNDRAREKMEVTSTADKIRKTQVIWFGPVKRRLYNLVRRCHLKEDTRVNKSKNKEDMVRTYKKCLHLHWGYWGYCSELSWPNMIHLSNLTYCSFYFYFLWTCSLKFCKEDILKTMFSLFQHSCSIMNVVLAWFVVCSLITLRIYAGSLSTRCQRFSAVMPKGWCKGIIIYLL